jgi:hypothetical protein
MDYIELEKLYKFHKENDISVIKHGVEIPTQETVEKLVTDYKIKGDISKYVQVLDDKKTVSFVLRIGGDFTIFQRVCSSTDEYVVPE